MVKDQMTAYSYYDYRHFIQDFLLTEKKRPGGLSMRGLCSKAGLSVSLISMVLKGERDLSPGSLKKILPHLRLSSDEKKYFKLLTEFDNEKNEDRKETALRKLEKHLASMNKDLNLIRKYRYLSSWYSVAIRELSNIDGFSFDAKWIQGKLKKRVSLEDIKKTLDFLIKNNFIQGTAYKTETKGKTDTINLRESIYSQSLKTFHKQLLGQAITAIEDVPKDKRLFLGHTFSINSDKLEESKKILEQAINELQKLNSSATSADSVYHISTALFPLTKGDES